MFDFVLFNHWLWFGLAVVLIILEVLLGTSFFLLWLGIISISVGIITWIVPTIAWQYQTLMFALGSLACVLMWIKFLKKNPIKTDRPTLNRRNEQYLGRIFTLKEPIVNGRGKIVVGDSTWRVEGPDLPAGTKVKVTDANGTLLQVKPTNEEI